MHCWDPRYPRYAEMRRKARERELAEWDASICRLAALYEMTVAELMADHPRIAVARYRAMGGKLAPGVIGKLA